MNDRYEDLNAMASRMSVQTRRRMGAVLVGSMLLAGLWSATPARPAVSAPNAPTASATLYPGGSVTAGHLETIWGGSGGPRVLAPQTYLFGNGIPAPDLNIQALQGSGSNSWRATNISGGSVQFTGGALRLYSPASGQTGWHFSDSHNVAACFGGCFGGATGAAVFGTPDLVFQQRLNTGDAVFGLGGIQVAGINQVHLSSPRWASLEVAAIGGPIPVKARMRWFVNGTYANTNPVDACTGTTPYGVAWRIRVNGDGSVDAWIRCANAVTNDWDAYGGTKFENYVGTAPAGTLLVGSGYLVNVNAYGGQSDPTLMTFNYIKNLNGAAATTSGEYTSPVIDGAFGAQWTSVTCSGVQTYGSAGSIDVYYRVWDGSAPGWSWLGQCNSDGSLSVPGAPRARYFQARFVFNPGTTGYRRLGGATVNYNPDTTAPTCTASPAPSGAWVSGNTSVTVTCTDNEALMPNGFASQNFGHTLNANLGGQVVSGTACNRNNTCTNYSFSPYNRDSTPPSVATGLGSGWNPGANPTYADGLSGVNMSTRQFLVDGTPRTIQPYGNLCADLNLSDGAHTARATAQDNAGNTGDTNNQGFNCDRTAPATAIGAITPEYRNTAPQLFYAPTSDGGSPFTTVRLLRRPSPTDPWTDSGALTNGMSWTPPAQGRWYVASKVTDQAGNVEPNPTGATDDATFFYDTIAPSAPTVLSVGPSNSRTPNVTWSAGSDPGAPTTGSGVWTYRVFILRPDNTLVTQYDVAAPTTNGNVNVSLPDGNYVARVVAIDRAGNQSTASASYPFSVDVASTFAGRVYSDATPLGQFNGEDGVPSVTMVLTQPTNAISTTTTNALGDYSFDGLETPGYYTVSVGTPPAGYLRTTPDQRRRLVVIGSDFSDIHFGMRYVGNLDTQLLWVNTECVDGRPFPLAPFTVQGPALNTVAATDAGGGWAAEVSQAGVYTVTLIDAGLTLVVPGDMNPVTVTVPAGGSAGARFVLACSNPAEERGAIVVRLYDADNAAGTPALFAGQVVTASNGISTLVGTTNAGGYVTFAGLVSGTWTVTAPVIGGQVLVSPGLQAYVQTVNVVAPIASQVRYGYRAQGNAVQTVKLAEDLTANGGFYLGDVVRYTLVVTNNTGSALTNVRITDTLPGGVSFGGIESVQPTGCSAGDNAGQVLATCPTLAAGQAMQIVFTATVTVAGQDLVNSFVWSADEFADENPGGTCVNAPCGGPAPRARVDVPGTAKQADVSAARMGEVVNYTIVVSNPSGVNLSVTVTDTLAVSATLESATPGYSQSGQVLVWENVAVPAGGTAVLTVTVRAGSGPLPGGYVLNNAVVILSDGVEVSRNAPGVQIVPWRVYMPIVRRQ